jgi:hypothetical protein
MVKIHTLKIKPHWDLQMPTHLILAVYKSDRGNFGNYSDKGG